VLARVEGGDGQGEVAVEEERLAETHLDAAAARERRVLGLETDRLHPPEEIVVGDAGDREGVVAVRVGGGIVLIADAVEQRQRAALLQLDFHVAGPRLRVGALREQVHAAKTPVRVAGALRRQEVGVGEGPLPQASRRDADAARGCSRARSSC
jgi:hypothetical protein